MYLYTADTFAAEGDEHFRTEWPLHRLVENLESNGELLMAAYIRGEELNPPDSSRHPYWAALEDAWGRMSGPSGAQADA